MCARRELTGYVFGRWTVISYAGDGYWLCRCLCESTRNVDSSSLLSGRSRSCGCLRVVVATKHGMHASPEYGAWAAMKGRCFNERNDWHASYGGRGISVHPPWVESFDVFFADMGSRPSAKHSLERKNNDGDYTPANCIWALPKEQQRNTRRNRFVVLNGERMTMAEAAERTNTPYGRFAQRIRRGLSPEEAARA